MELSILGAAIEDRKVFELLQALDIQQDLSDQGVHILKAVGDYYETDQEATSADVVLVARSLRRRHPRHTDTFERIFDRLRDRTWSAQNIFQDIVETKQEAIATDLAGRLLTPGRSGVPELIERYLSVEDVVLSATQGTDTVYQGSSLEEVFEASSQENKLVLFPRSLNRRIDGGVMPGDNVLIFGRPEIGKSLILINAVCGFLAQGKKVLVYSNEDSTSRMLPRYISRITERTKAEILADMESAEQLLVERGYENLRFVHDAPGNFRTINRHLDEFEADVVAIDQLRNLDVGQPNKVLQMEEAAQGARALAAQRQIVVLSTTQAGDSAENRLVLGQGDVDYSNTGIPGAMDIMIGVGCNPDLENRGFRMLSLCKNKTGGGHEHFQVNVDPRISKVIGGE